MSGYRWRGWTARHEALRQWADAQWEHDQRRNGQLNRHVRAAAEASSPAADAARTAHPTAPPPANRGTTP